jgi:hypothetical protein
MKCGPWSSSLGVGFGADDSTPEEFAFTTWRRPRLTRGYRAIKEEEESYMYITLKLKHPVNYRKCFNCTNYVESEEMGKDHEV